MKKYIFISPEGSTEAPNSSYEVNNMQVIGIVEDVTEIILNLKQVRFKQQIEGTDSETVVVSISGQDKLTAGDLGKFTSAFQVLNSDLVICNMESSVKLEILSISHLSINFCIIST